MHHRPKTGEQRFLVGKSSYCSACNQDCIKPAQHEFDMYLSSPTLQQKARASLDLCPSTKPDVASLSAVTTDELMGRINGGFGPCSWVLEFQQQGIWAAPRCSSSPSCLGSSLGLSRPRWPLSRPSLRLVLLAAGGTFPCASAPPGECSRWH